METEIIEFDKIEQDIPAPKNEKKVEAAPERYRHLRLQMAELRRQLKDADNRISHLNEKRKKLNKELKIIERFYNKVKQS